MIRAEAHSDDQVVKVRFDATNWFRGASTDSIVRLADCDWGGDYPADEVAIHLAENNRELQRLFSYLETIADDPGKKDVKGFECHISEADALAWLKRWKYAAWRKITQEDRPSTKQCKCGRQLAINVIECGACGHTFSEAEVLAAIYA